MRTPLLQWTTIGVVRVELAEAAGQLGQWDDRRAGDPADGDLLGVAHIQDERPRAAVHQGLELDRRDLALGRCGGVGLGAADPAELLVVDELADRRLRPADRAFRVLADLHLAEGHVERVVEQEPADQRVARAQDQLDGLGRLHDADQARQDPQHAPLRAVGHQVRRRRLRVEASVARPVRRVEHRRLAVEPEDRAVHVRLAQHHARVVDQVPRREVVRAVDDDVVAGEHLQRIRAIDRMLVPEDDQVGVDRPELLLGAVDLGPAHVAGEVDDLALEVRDVDDVEVGQADRADARRGQIEG